MFQLYSDMKLPDTFFLKYFDKEWEQWVDIGGEFALEMKIKIEIGEYYCQHNHFQLDQDF